MFETVEIPPNATPGKVRMVMVPPASGFARVSRQIILVLTAGLLLGVPLAFGGRQPWIPPLAHLVVFVIALLWLAQILATRQVELVYCPPVLPLLFFVTYIVARGAGAVVELPARLDMMAALAILLLFLATLHSPHHRAELPGAAWVFVGFGVLLSFYGLLQVAVKDPTVWGVPAPSTAAGRALGSFLRPADLGAYLTIAGLLGAGFFFFSRLELHQKSVLGVAAIMLGGGLLLTVAPSAWFGALGGLAVLGFYLLRRRGWRFRWLALALGLSGVLSSAALIAVKAQQLSSGEPAPWPLWQAAAAIGRDHLLWGAGPGMFRWLYGTHRTLQGNFDSASNAYLTLFAEYGLVGLLLALWCLVSFAIALVQITTARAQRYSSATLSNRYAFVVGTLAALVALAIQSCGDGVLATPAIRLMLAVMLPLALTCGVHVAGKLEHDATQPGRYHTLYVKGPLKHGLALAVGMVLVLFASRLVRTVPAAYYTLRAEHHRQVLDWNAARAAYQQAWRADPRDFRVAAAAGDCALSQATWDPARREELVAEAVHWYERVNTLNPLDADALLAIARGYELIGKQTEALDRYQRAVQMDSENAAMHVALGLYLVRQNQPDQAEDSFRHAHDLDPDNLTVKAQLPDPEEE